MTKTGESFRRILKGLILASSGKNVIFVMDDDEKLDWHFRKAVDICSVYGLEEPVKITRWKIKFPVGVLVFINSDEHNGKVVNIETQRRKIHELKT